MVSITILNKVVMQRNALFSLLESLIIAILLFAFLVGSCKPDGPIIIQPPVGLPSMAYTHPSTGVITIHPPVGLPTQIYPSQTPSSPVTVQPPVGLPTYIYGR